MLKPESVRLATPADKPKMVYVARALADESENGHFVSIRDLPYDEEKVKLRLEQGCAGQGGVIGVIDDGGAIVGSVGIFATQPWFSSAWELTMFWMYVDPDYRAGTHHARDLLDFAEWFREDRSAAAGFSIPMELSISSADRLPAKMRLLKSRAEYVGGIFTIRG